MFLTPLYKICNIKKQPSISITWTHEMLKFHSIRPSEQVSWQVNFTQIFKVSAL